MSLKAMVARHDNAALEALSSRGLLRRAERDVSAGKASVVQLEDDQGIVQVEENTVTLRAAGPGESHCTCRAVGICRHILAAQLLLRNHFEAPTPDAEQAPDVDARVDQAEAGASVVDQICALTQAHLRKFAGADWDDALTMSNAELALSFTDNPSSTTVGLTEINAAVTFIRDEPLKNAAFKGPKTRRRLLTCVAALALRKRQGVGAVAEVVAAPVKEISDEFVSQAQAIIERAVAATLPSRSTLAHDLFLDLAISSRCETLPRLSAELRGLAGAAHLANERSIEFDGSRFLLDAARTYALLPALRHHPELLVLTGSSRRTFHEQPPMDIWPLGVARWRSRAGARGLTAYAYVPEQKQWLASSTGRTAGADPGFTVESAYFSPAWEAGTFSGLMGYRVHLSKPRVSEDGALNLQAQGKTLDRVNLSELRQQAVTAWDELHEQLQERLGAGLRRGQNPLPVLLAPRKFGQLGFDELAQHYRWQVFDERGDGLQLTIPGDQSAEAQRLSKLGDKIEVLVVEATLREAGLHLRPVSALLADGKNLLVCNLDFDDWPLERRVRSPLQRLRQKLSRPLEIEQSNQTVEQLLSDCAECLQGVVGSAPVDATPLVRRAESLGLTTLGAALQHAAQQRTVRSCLKAAYVASELAALHALARPG
ncbi:MAG: hypothetical protein AAF529_00755 [Pseudomonadota bacterium]